MSRNEIIKAKIARKKGIMVHEKMCIDLSVEKGGMKIHHVGAKGAKVHFTAYDKYQRAGNYKYKNRQMVPVSVALGAIYGYH